MKWQTNAAPATGGGVLLWPAAGRRNLKLWPRRLRILGARL
jgi:hypothetical protein